MSWSDYVDNFLVNYTDTNNGTVYNNINEHGAIFGNTDGTIWASTPGFSLKVENVEQDNEDGSGTHTVQVNEFENLKSTFDNNGVAPKTGVRINGEKYFVVNFDADRSLLYLKKNGGGASVARTGQAYVIGVFNSSKQVTVNGTESPQNPGVTNLVVERLQTFLTENNL